MSFLRVAGILAMVRRKQNAVLVGLIPGYGVGRLALAQ
jgi:hypothetical protein